MVLKKYNITEINTKLYIFNCKQNYRMNKKKVIILDFSFIIDSKKVVDINPHSM